MTAQLDDFIRTARAKGLADDQIRAKLQAAGWTNEEIGSALGDDLVAPLPPARRANRPETQSPMTKREENVRLKMFEYNMMFLTLWASAISAFISLNIFLFGDSSTDARFPLTALIVCLPVLAIFFKRVTANEQADPELKHLSGRLWLVQNSQGLAFIILLIHTIALVYQLIGGGGKLPEQFLSWAVSVFIFGGIFAYYWSDSHRAARMR